MAVAIRNLVVPLWLLACTLVAALAASAGIETIGLLLLISGLAVVASILGKDAVLSPVLDGAPVMIALPRPAPAAVRLFSWPNSGFRNIGRGTKGG
jgi:hypothetical protein